MANDAIMELVMRLLCVEKSAIHVATPNFFSTLMSDGWDEAKKFFRPRDKRTMRDVEPLRDRDLKMPSQDATVLIIITHTGPTTGGHWSTLIRDARGVGIERARWRYFDTLVINDRRAEQVRGAITSSPLWKAGMTWERVATPQQAPRSDACGPLSFAISVSYVRWTEKLNHERLNSNDIQVTLSTNAETWGTAARQLTRDSAQSRKLPQQHRAIRSIRFKTTRQHQVGGTTRRAAAADYF